ncbi:hypothetical protein pdam_00007584, partial [Pocillopora damicornis]
VLVLLTSCVAVCSLPCSQNLSSLATCLGMDSNKTSSDDILRFIHRRGYMIVPPSNPPTQDQGSRKKRSIHSVKCPFTYAVIDFIDTVPRFVSNATCSGCDVLQGGLLHSEASSQEMRRLLAMGGARHSSCIFFGNGTKSRKPICVETEVFTLLTNSDVLRLRMKEGQAPPPPSTPH